ncbi:trypsin eta-like [Episyrphus balteatus]|uniref:trypsin eta-like n=1 Tax=Episyrphus balteatus TaxID=286459 RepID=UPI002485093E|nr:trypsin eta-like [Episyrphus balteatus]
MLKNLCIFVLLTVLYCTCATPIQPRIVGGQIVDISKHPYFASVRIKSCSSCPYIHKCGASIYSDKVLITAAQCLMNLDSKWRIMVVAGANSRSGADGVQIPVEKNVTHSGYNFWTIDNDIALLFLQDGLPLNEIDIKTISIADKMPLPGKSATVSGWGWDAEDGGPTYFLHDAVVSIVDNASCEKIYGAGEITNNMICAGLKKGGKDGCQEDTGGPLVVDNNLVGLVSWGRGCAREGYPGVYTYVPSHKEWIDKKIIEIEMS